MALNPTEEEEFQREFAREQAAAAQEAAQKRERYAQFKARMAQSASGASLSHLSGTSDSPITATANTVSPQGPITHACCCTAHCAAPRGTVQHRAAPRGTVRHCAVAILSSVAPQSLSTDLACVCSSVPAAATAASATKVASTINFNGGSQRVHINLSQSLERRRKDTPLTIEAILKQHFDEHKPLSDLPRMGQAQEANLSGIEEHMRFQYDGEGANYNWTDPHMHNKNVANSIIARMSANPGLQEALKNQQCRRDQLLSRLHVLFTNARNLWRNKKNDPHRRTLYIKKLRERKERVSCGVTSD